MSIVGHIRKVVNRYSNSKRQVLYILKSRENLISVSERHHIYEQIRIQDQEWEWYRGVMIELRSVGSEEHLCPWGRTRTVSLKVKDQRDGPYKKRVSDVHNEEWKETSLQLNSLSWRVRWLNCTEVYEDLLRIDETKKVSTIVEDSIIHK